MKNKFLLTFIFISLNFSTLEVYAESPLPYLTPQCPKQNELIRTTLKDKDELLISLETIVPDVYPVKIWKIELVQPLNTMMDSPYFGMAKLRCGEEVAKNSWYVRLFFPENLPSGSASTGIMFVVKTKENSWKVCFQYK